MSCRIGSADRRRFPGPRDGSSDQSWSSGGNRDILERQQANRASANYRQRIEVGIPAQQSPVQAGTREAVPADQVEGGDHVTHVHAVADGNARHHRFVGSAQRPVSHCDDSTTREHPGERDHAGTRRMHLAAQPSAQIHAAVTAAPTVLGQVEAVCDLIRRGAERPLPRCRPGGVRSRASQARKPGEQNGKPGDGQESKQASSRRDPRQSGCTHVTEAGAGIRRYSGSATTLWMQATRTATCGRFRIPFAESAPAVVMA